MDDLFDRPFGHTALPALDHVPSSAITDWPSITILSPLHCFCGLATDSPITRIIITGFTTSGIQIEDIDRSKLFFDVTLVCTKCR